MTIKRGAPLVHLSVGPTAITERPEVNTFTKASFDRNDLVATLSMWLKDLSELVQ